MGSYRTEIYEDQQFLDLMQRQLDESDTVQELQQQFLLPRPSAGKMMPNMTQNSSSSHRVQPQYFRQQQLQQQQQQHHLGPQVNCGNIYYQPIEAQSQMTSQELMPPQQQQDQQQAMSSYCAATETIYDEQQQQQQHYLDANQTVSNNGNCDPYQQHPHYLHHQSQQQHQQEYLNINDGNNIYYVPSQQQQLQQQTPHVVMPNGDGAGGVGLVGAGGNNTTDSIPNLIQTSSPQSTLLLQPLQQQQHQQGAEDLLLESLEPIGQQLGAGVSPSTATTELTMGSYGAEIYEEQQYLDLMQSQLDGEDETIEQQQQQQQQISSRPSGGGGQYNIMTSQPQQLQHQPQPKPLSQLDFIDMNNRVNISQEWLDVICRHMIEHMNHFGICVIDDFLGSLKGDMILKEVLQLYNTGIYTEGRLVGSSRMGGSNANGQTKQQQHQARNSNTNSIRSDRVIWIDGYEDGCVEINNLIQTLCSVISNSSRLSAFTNNDLDKIIINRRTKAHVACYPGNGTRYIKHVDNPNGDGRVITAIYYLNKNWNTKCDGGLLRMFPAGMDTVANIEPLFDRVIFFWSDRRNPHEVLPAYRDRFAITVWYIGESRQ